MQKRIVVHIVGLPGSGKSTIARGLCTLCKCLLTTPCTLIEVSDVVKEWIQRANGIKTSIYRTPTGSNELFRLLQSKIAKQGITIISGVREPFLIGVAPDARRLIVWVETSLQERRRRYVRLKKGTRAFAEAEARAAQLRTVSLRKTISRFIEVSGTETVCETVDIIFNELRKLIGGSDGTNVHS